MRRFSPKALLVVVFASTALLAASCSSGKSSDTTVATETSVAAADTTPVSVDTTEAAAEAVEETSAAVETSAAATETVASETTAAAGVDPAAAAGSLNDVIIGQMIVGMTGQATADPADVKCISDKVPEKDLTAIMGSAAGGAPDPNSMKSLIKAVFVCKPKGLSESFIKSTFTDIPGDVTDKQKSCLADGLFGAIGKDDSVVDAIIADTDNMPDSLKKEFGNTVKGCVPAGASRDALIKEIEKNS